MIGRQPAYVQHMVYHRLVASLRLIMIYWVLWTLVILFLPLKRPYEIVEDPQLIVNGIKRTDPNQGDLGK